ncbi:hypothetical protein [Alistipes sp.]|uniref:hypothetical protein n=1 Tax=Alistipes sp. TaxID=1872444 RepID=UPI003AF17359
MKLRRYISLVLLAVYLFATGGTAYASVSCECVSKAPTVSACCHHHCTDIPCGGRDGDSLTAPCCGDRHSTEIELYTGSGSENERGPRCVVLDLPPALAATCPCPAHVPFLRLKAVERPAPFLPDLRILPIGFRAPPVLA